MNRTITQICILFLVIALAVPAFAGRVIAELEYFYADDGTLIGKAFNGKRVNFEYDLRGQLLAVKDASGKDLERYTYDPAGNRLSKTINSVTTTYTYDKANQLVTSTVNGVITHYKYDAAGKMIQAGDKTYIYNGQNKVSEVRQNGKTIAKFEYNIDGQIAKAIYGDKVEEFMWDGLALIWRSGVTYINEPSVTGGNPVMAGDDVLFNDMLGSTLAVNGNPVEMTSFGETADKNAFFTGKPMVDELGYSFLFRDYNPNHGKWTTSDPLGYPDGWNNLAYVNNEVVGAIDWLGGEYYQITISLSAIAGGGAQVNGGFSYDRDTGNINFTGGFGGGSGCNISASLGITVNEDSPSSSSTIVTTEAGGGFLGKATIVASSDANGNLGGGGTIGVALTPYSGSVSISQQWTTTLFNVNNIADAINAAYSPNDGWLSGFFYDIFYRSGNTPNITVTTRPE